MAACRVGGTARVARGDSRRAGLSAPFGARGPLGEEVQAGHRLWSTVLVQGRPDGGQCPGWTLYPRGQAGSGETLPSLLGWARPGMADTVGGGLPELGQAAGEGRGRVQSCPGGQGVLGRGGWELRALSVLPSTHVAIADQGSSTASRIPTPRLREIT